jgi:hypothetical protein
MTARRSSGRRTLSRVGVCGRSRCACAAFLGAAFRCRAAFLCVDFLCVDRLCVDFLGVDFLGVDFLGVDFLRARCRRAALLRADFREDDMLEGCGCETETCALPQICGQPMASLSARCGKTPDLRGSAGSESCATVNGNGRAQRFREYRHGTDAQRAVLRSLGARPG